MSQNTIERSVIQARNVGESEFVQFCNRLLQSIGATEKDGDKNVSLTQLFLLLRLSKGSRRIPPQLIDKMGRILLSTGKPLTNNNVLSGTILKELLPDMTADFFLDSAPLDEVRVTYMLSVASVQSCSDAELLQRLVPLLIKWISTVGLHREILSSSLCSLMSVGKFSKDIYIKEQAYIINSQLIDWMSNASLQQAPNPYSRGLFRKDTNEELVTEIDGVVTKDMFTPLCIGQYYRGDQLMNIYSFSLLRQWLLSCREQKQSEDYSKGEVEPTLETTVQFCLRVLEQCNRKPKVSSDLDVQLAILAEAISLLDCVCNQDASYIPKVIDQMKNVGNKLSVNQSRAMIPLMQFFLNHSDAVVHDAFQLYNSFFDVVLEANYASPTAAYEAVTFIRKNLQVLCYRTPLLQKYFPNILKVFAWNPRTFLSDFVEIIPIFLSPSTSLEVVHILLDLPCLSAALELLRQGTTRSDTTPPHVQEAVEKLSDQRYKPMYTFIIRNQSGFGDTIDRLDVLHQLLDCLKSHPRVVMCSEAVPVLLKLAFRTVLDEGDKFLAGNLVSVLLERSGLLYGNEAFKKPVRKVISSQLDSIFRKYPSLIIDQFSELLEFVGTIRNITDRQDFFEHVVWVVGEYLSTLHDVRCKPENISAMYEALEAVSYEAAGIMQSSLVSSDDGTTYTPSLLTTLMSSVAKLASRSQDLIPRVMLCLTKLGQLGQSQHFDEISRDAISQRSSELLNIMKLPHIAAVILSPPPAMESGRWHKNNLELPVLLRATNDILQSKTMNAGLS